jgi:hypothetical protein
MNFKDGLSMSTIKGYPDNCAKYLTFGYYEKHNITPAR